MDQKPKENVDFIYTVVVTLNSMASCLNCPLTKPGSLLVSQAHLPIPLLLHLAFKVLFGLRLRAENTEAPWEGRRNKSVQESGEMK